MAISKAYKPVVRAKSDNLAGAALVGTNSAIIGWTMDAKKRPKDLRGFSLKRTDFDPNTGDVERIDWLKGQKRFKAARGSVETDVRSDEAPFQRFRWSDYTLKPGRAYLYEVFPMTGKPGSLKKGDPLKFNMRPSYNSEGGIGIYSNRGVTAASAYLRRFGGRKPNEVENNEAFNWLERGLKQSLLDFIESAKAGEALHVSIYEFFNEEVAVAFKAAKKKGVDVRIVYHAKAGKKATRENEAVLSHFGLKSVATPRSNTKISHNKFVVHLNKRSKPMRLWTGSANFSDNAFYYQTNVAMVFEKLELAAAYEDYWQILNGNPTRTKTKDRVIALHQRFEDSPPPPAKRLMFSPVRNQHVVQTAMDLIKEAKSALFLSAPFGIGSDIINEIEANNPDIIEYGLANAVAKKKIEGLRRANTRFFTPSRLETYMGRRWDAAAFGAHKIHAKTLIIDPWSNNPSVLIGSANFSKPSCVANDENSLLVRGDKRFAAMITTEFMRMYDHYKIRYWIKKLNAGDAKATQYLDETSKWADIYFRRSKFSRKFRDREVFSGSQ
ncbi:phospholipase D-like domain-containing protein [Thermodesulfobacteriota bacterium]